LDVVQPALVQMVRNAIAHGIETEEERRRTGKPAAGSLALEVSRRGQRVTFRCRDDGRGIDLDAVERKLRQAGTLPARAGRPASSELLRLLLRGGLSTAESVTQMAGRGIGLDVVRETAERLKGEVSATTEPGRGTTVQLDVPVQVASFEALVVQAGGVNAA